MSRSRGRTRRYSPYRSSRYSTARRRSPVRRTTVRRTTSRRTRALPRSGPEALVAAANDVVANAHPAEVELAAGNGPPELVERTRSKLAKQAMDLIGQHKTTLAALGGAGAGVGALLGGQYLYKHKPSFKWPTWGRGQSVETAESATPRTPKF